MNLPEGSLWRKWDLHVHTPASHTSKYGGGEQGWERFLNDLRALPHEMSVIGISDYMWLDGYERVLDEHEKGNLSNIEVLFPVIELRLRDFIGTKGQLARLNAHAVFAPGTDPELIKLQFMGRLVSSFSLTDSYQGLQGSWDAVPTREAVEELGRMIKGSVPAGELHQYGADSTEGFNNWVISFDTIVDAIDDSSVFREKPLLALGKTEWESIPWNDNTVATKKTLISKCAFLFTAAESPDRCGVALEKLRDAGVNSHLLDCSDAHNLSTSTDKDRLGNSATWICADPTLAGLKHALFEYRSRVFIGLKPPLLVRQQADPTNFVSRLKINSSNDTQPPSPAFDVDLPLNGGFVAVIGNKGSGKSALLDSMALVLNAHSEKDFSFLSHRRFRNPRNNRAPLFQAEVSTVDGTTFPPMTLDQPVDLEAPERIRYLPQSLLESLCNKEPGAPDDAFEEELRAIIFSHVPEHQRLGSRSLDELLERRGQGLDQKISQARRDLSNTNQKIAQVEELVRPSRARKLQASLNAVVKQLAEHDASRPPQPEAVSDVQAEASTDDETTSRIRSELGELQQNEEVARQSYEAQRTKLDAAANLLGSVEAFRASVDAFEGSARVLAGTAELDLEAIVKIEIDSGPLNELIGQLSTDVLELEARLGANGEFAQQRTTLVARLAEAEALLDAPRRQLEQQRRDLEAWEKARAELVGTTTQPDTLEFLKGQVADLERLPGRLEELREKRISESKAIHSFLASKVAMFRELYAPVEEFIKNNELQEAMSIEFEAHLETRDFEDRFVSNVDRGVAGSFFGVPASSQRIRARVRVVEADEWASVGDFVQQHELDLRFDRRPGMDDKQLDAPSDVLRSGRSLVALYDFLFGLSYLEPEYELRSGGRPITELSPGQKGTILLMFYLLVDQSGRPIALDQPDENLDNHTVHTLLRPAIRSAKQQRQVFVVTHSPNLAIVGDADQVIVASLDGEFSYVSGSIENPAVRDQVVTILEGTWPAFADRQRKYSATEVVQAFEDLDD